MGEGDHNKDLNTGEDDDDRRSQSSISFYGNSDDSILYSTSSDLADDASSSSPSSFDLSSLVAQLPVKRGLALSRYFEGKSESFRSLSDVRCVGDLVKQETQGCRKIRSKASGDYGGFDSTQKRRGRPRFHGRAISKKTSKGSSVFWQARRSRNAQPADSAQPAVLKMYSTFA